MMRGEFEKEIRAARSSADNPADRPKRRISTVWPFLIVVLALIFATARNSITLYHHVVVICRQNDSAQGALKKAADQAAFVDSLKADLDKVAITDPVAAQIDSEFFPPTTDPTKTNN